MSQKGRHTLWHTLPPHTRHVAAATHLTTRVAPVIITVRLALRLTRPAQSSRESPQSTVLHSSYSPTKYKFRHFYHTLPHTTVHWIQILPAPSKVEPENGIFIWHVHVAAFHFFPLLETVTWNLKPPLAHTHVSASNLPSVFETITWT